MAAGTTMRLPLLHYAELGRWYFTGERRGYFSEYRYDALGRRVLVRTRRDGLCNTNQTSTVDCTSGIERYVWAGDNILWEMRGPGGNTETAERLEQVDAVPQEYGIVGYTHAGGVDRPLVAYKTAGGNSGAVVVPHMNWRGLFAFGTNQTGGASTVAVEWPGFRTTATHSMGEAATKNWMGSLLEGQRDAGGLVYMRNRYYDPATGQFTQTDPIGIAGGLNTYGFAAGDPITYTDPYGLCPIDWTIEQCQEQVQQAIHQLRNHRNSVCREVGANADKLNRQGLIKFDRQSTDFGYVRAHPDPQQAATGASVPPIYLGPASFINQHGTVVMKETRNTIAHEVYHLLRPGSGIPQNDVLGGPAYVVGDQCAVDPPTQ
jgi:RHS repeat-associated protein